MDHTSVRDQNCTHISYFTCLPHFVSSGIMTHSTNAWHDHSCSAFTSTTDFPTHPPTLACLFLLFSTFFKPVFCLGSSVPRIQCAVFNGGQLLIGLLSPRLSMQVFRWRCCQSARNTCTTRSNPGCSTRAMGIKVGERAVTPKVRLSPKAEQEHIHIFFLYARPQDAPANTGTCRDHYAES